MPHDSNRLRVLHADDDQSFLILFRRAIERAPSIAERCFITSVSDGTQAVDYVCGIGEFSNRKSHPIPDLIILDQRMTKMDGLEALRAIRAHPAGQRAVVAIFSTSSQDALTSAAIAGGATFCIEKPLEFEKLTQKLHLILSFALDALELPRIRREAE